MFEYLSIDWGLKRSGLAFGNPNLVLAYQQELMTKDIWQVLDLEILKRKTKVLVVGVPTNFFGQKTQTSYLILDFIDELKIKYSELKIEAMEEKGSTRLSKKMLKTDKHDINHQSAVNILNWYFEKINYGTR
jgi:RNase H-fold protein (predicted Holliday junction resolvase)